MANVIPSRLYSRPNNRRGSINEKRRLVNNGVIDLLSYTCMDRIISARQLRLNQYVEALIFLGQDTDRLNSHNLSSEKNKDVELHSGS
jgi:hypothetical protein